MYTFNFIVKITLIRHLVPYELIFLSIIVIKYTLILKGPALYIYEFPSLCHDKNIKHYKVFTSDLLRISLYTSRNNVNLLKIVDIIKSNMETYRSKVWKCLFFNNCDNRISFYLTYLRQKA